MKTELLLKEEIPHTVKRGKTTRKLWTNYLMTSHYQKYGQIHKQWKKETTPLIRESYKANMWGHETETQYQVSIGFKRGKSTKRCDADGMSLLLKWGIDLLVDLTPLPDDSIQYINEVRCVYLGPSEDGQEHVYLQLTKEVYDDRE